MFYFQIIILIALLCSGLEALLKPKWKYEFVEAFMNSSDPQLIQINMKIERISRGTFGITSNLNTTIPLSEDYSFVSETYRNRNGVGEYVKMPYTYRARSFIEAMNTLYRNTIMADIKNCSNLPQIEFGWKGPMVPNNYYLDKCIFGADKFPTVVQPGFYKIQLQINGPVKIFVQVLGKVETDD